MTTLADNPVYEAIPAFYKAAENVLNEHLDASIVATTNAAAKAAPQANSALLSYDSSSYRGRGGRGHYNPDRGRAYGPRYHARGPWKSESTTSSDDTAYYQNKHAGLTCSNCGGLGHISRNCGSRPGIKRERDETESSPNSTPSTKRGRGRGSRGRRGGGGGGDKVKKE